MTSKDRSAEAILAVLPDIPRWVETRGMLLAGQGDPVAHGANPGDFIVRARSTPLVVVAGRPPLDALREISGSPDVGVVLCVPEEAAEVALVLPVWKRVEAVIHRLADESVPVVAAPRGVHIGMLPEKEALAPRDRLSHLPDRLRQELLDTLAGGHVAAAFVDGSPVAFCYPVWETETLWDISIDTLEEHRRRGLAAACVSFLIDHMRRHGKEPVWGALEDNAASLALAEKLGFEPIDRMTVFLRPPLNGSISDLT
jgi:GNAT superfamily N-acetyltransferase